MSEICNWENLPKDITEDFISFPGDYDYPLYLSEKEEWTNYKYLGKRKGKVAISEPCLIAELNRLVPYFEDGVVKFHPLNMPYIKMGKTEIVGFVISTSEDGKFYEYQVDDGTGFINIYHEKYKFRTDQQRRYFIDKKYRKCARMVNMNELLIQECPSKFPDPRPGFYYPSGTNVHDMAIIENNWALETNNGLFGMEVTRCDYVHAIGYCSLDFADRKKSRTEITFEDLSTAKLNFYAIKVTRIDESRYNAKLHSWLHTFIQRRYIKPEKQ